MASFPTLDPVVPHYFDPDAPAIETRSLAFRFTGESHPMTVQRTARLRAAAAAPRDNP
jgi:hypothetical protein